MAVSVYNSRQKQAKRVSADEAAKLVREGWEYITKSEYKRIVSGQAEAPTQ